MKIFFKRHRTLKYTLLILLCTAYMFYLPYRVVMVSGPSMNCCSMNGDFPNFPAQYHDRELVVVKKGNVKPQKWHTYIIKHGPDTIIKRAIFVPGDKVCILINKSVKNIFYKSPQASDLSLFKVPSITVRYRVLKDDEWFYLGDNRLESEDCATYGIQKTSEIQGEVVGKITP